jgi:hypothetical protein
VNTPTVDAPADKKSAAELLQPYFEAGATWFIALAAESPEQYLEIMHAGPPV